VARREAPAAIRKIADTTGLRFSARHPLRGRFFDITLARDPRGEAMNLAERCNGLQRTGLIQIKAK